ncbi:MAG: M20/M25/M40 family metallo-hydrolase [Actinobacteria bacterium]|nr:M20/M25/M40 family metallo-hydrolase [Actinomycetota bacterium]
MTNFDAIRHKVLGSGQRYIDDLKHACSIPSVSTEGMGFEAMADWVEEKLQKLGAEVSRLSVPGSPEALLGNFDAGAGRTLMIYDHYDVQPVDPLHLWESPPFQPTIRDEKLYARGAADNKGDLVARLCALEVYRDMYGDLPYNLKFLIEGEEESGSIYFEDICAAHAEQLRADDCVWEGGWFDLDGRPEMYFGCKGLLYIELHCHRLLGDQHSSTAVYAPSAAWEVLQAIASFRDAAGEICIEGFHDRVVAPGPQEMELIDAIPFNEEAQLRRLGITEFVGARTGSDLKRHLLCAPTANIDGLSAGYAVPGGQKTVLPAEAFAKLDFRLVPDQDAHDIAEKVQQHLKKKGFGHVKMTILSAENPSRSPLDSMLGDVAKATAARWFDKPATVYPLMWATGPMHVITHDLGIPICSPPGVGRPDSNVHAPNEHIHIHDFIDVIGYTVAYLKKYADRLI